MRVIIFSFAVMMSMLSIGMSAGEVLAVDKMRFTMRADSEAGHLGTKILKIAYRRLGIEISVDGLPGVRAINEANNGNSDGEIVRLKRVLVEYRNLRAVPEPIVTIDSHIASKDKSIKVEGWATVKKYSVTTVRGYRTLEQRLKGYDHILMPDVKSALKMLKRDRVQILVLTKFDILRGLKQTGYQGIFILEPPVSRLPLHHMLNKKHEALVPKISAVLKAMKADGTHKKIYDAFLADYEN